MSDAKNLLFLPGDGIGPEVMGQVRKIIDWLAKNRSINFNITEGLVGGACFYIHSRLKRKQIVRAQDKRSNRMVKKKGMLRLNYGISLPIESFRVWKTTDK